MAQIVLRGRGEVVSFYNLAEDLDFDINNYNTNSQNGQEELYEALKERIDSKEIDELASILQMRLLFAGNTEILLDENSFNTEDFKLKNRDLKEIFDSLDNINEGDIFYLQKRVGDGEFSFDVNIDNLTKEQVELSYIECSEDKLDVIKDDIQESLCDTIDIDKLSVKDAVIEEANSYFDATVIIDELYGAKFDKESQKYVLERLSVGGERLIGTDCYVDDFEKN